MDWIYSCVCKSKRVLYGGKVDGTESTGDLDFSVFSLKKSDAWQCLFTLDGNSCLLYFSVLLISKISNFSKRRILLLRPLCFLPVGPSFSVIFSKIVWGPYQPSWPLLKILCFPVNFLVKCGVTNWATQGVIFSRHTASLWQPWDQSLTPAPVCFPWNNLNDQHLPGTMKNQHRHLISNWGFYKV